MSQLQLSEDALLPRSALKLRGSSGGGSSSGLRRLLQRKSANLSFSVPAQVRKRDCMPKPRQSPRENANHSKPSRRASKLLPSAQSLRGSRVQVGKAKSPLSLLPGPRLSPQVSEPATSFVAESSCAFAGSTCSVAEGFLSLAGTDSSRRVRRRMAAAAATLTDAPGGSSLPHHVVCPDESSLEVLAPASSAASPLDIPPQDGPAFVHASSSDSSSAGGCATTLHRGLKRQTVGSSRTAEGGHLRPRRAGRKAGASSIQCTGGAAAPHAPVPDDVEAPPERGLRKEVLGMKGLRRLRQRLARRLLCANPSKLQPPAQRRARKRRAAAERQIVAAAAAGDESAIVPPALPFTARQEVLLQRLRQASVGNLLTQATEPETVQQPGGLTAALRSSIKASWHLETSSGKFAIVLHVLGAGCSQAWVASPSYICLTLEPRPAPEEHLWDTGGKLLVPLARVVDAGTFSRYSKVHACYERLPPGDDYRVSISGVDAERARHVVSVSDSPTLRACIAFVPSLAEVQAERALVESLAEVLPERMRARHEGHRLVFHGANNSGLVTIVDLSGPVLVKLRRMRCKTCLPNVNLDPTDADIIRVFPRAVRWNVSGGRHAVWHTFEWILQLWLRLSLDPHMMHVYTAMVQKWGDRYLERVLLGALSPAEGPLPDWQLACLPSLSTLQRMFVKFTECFVDDLCDAVEDDIAELDMEDLVVDGNRKIARIVLEDGERPYNMILGSAGSLGFLSAPGTLCHQEDAVGWRQHLEQRFTRRKRRCQGIHPRHGQPRNITTDAPHTYGPGLLSAVYCTWSERISANNPGVPREKLTEEQIGTRICKDLKHCDLNFRECLHRGHADASDGESCHSDICAGWTAPLRPDSLPSSSGAPISLDTSLLRKVLHQARRSGSQGLRQFARERSNILAVRASREFFKSALVTDASWWKAWVWISLHGHFVYPSQGLHIV